MLFPINLHLRLRWRYISRLQFKAKGPNFHAELVPVHSPLLRESFLVSYPPLTYMLKFSGFADLTSCSGRSPKWGTKREATHQQHNKEHIQDVQPVVRQQVPSYTACVRGRPKEQHPNTQTRSERRDHPKVEHVAGMR